MGDFSDYIIFVDESGDHGLETIDPQFPVFALVFCIFRKSDYIAKVVPAIQQFKFDFCGHDGFVLHEHELRKSLGDFSFLRRDRLIRNQFLERLSILIDEAPFKAIAAIIRKDVLRRKYVDPWNPYELALTFCMERSLELLVEGGQSGRTTHVLFEGRGRREDNELELVFRRICDNAQRLPRKRPIHAFIKNGVPDFSKVQFEPRFLPKSVNSSSLQLADLIARPLALRILRPEQENRTHAIIEKNCLN